MGTRVSVIGLTGSAWAQSPVAQQTRQVKLLALSAWLEQRDVSAAPHTPMPAVSASRFAGNCPMAVYWNCSAGHLARGPVFYLTFNIDAADTVSTDDVWPGGSAGLCLSGSGMTMAQWDGGAVFAEHPDFAGRLSQVDGATEVSGHSTHGAGTLIGDGDDYPNRAGWPGRRSPPPTGSVLLIGEDFSGGLPAGWSVDTLMGVPWTIESPGGGCYQNDTGRSGDFAAETGATLGQSMPKRSRTSGPSASFSGPSQGS